MKRYAKNNKIDFSGIKKEFNRIKAWGLLSSIDLYNCNPEYIRDKEKIKTYAIELCELIKMKRYGDCEVVNFGEDQRVAGYSMTQLIETSLISGHFANQTNTSYIDIFSCQLYDPQKAADFTKNFFEADKYNIQIIFRK